jgi:hypothetical protein
MSFPGAGSGFEFHWLDFVHEAPRPGLAGLDGPHQRVLTSVEVLGGVFIFRRVTASDVSAFEAHPQVNPGVPVFYAVLTNALVGLGKLDLIQVRTFQRHCFLRQL